MSVEARKSLVQRFFAEVFNQQRQATAAEILASDFVAIFRVAGGQLVEAWVNSDFLSLMQQIGAIPAPGQAQA
jgi:hypothetical protein